MSPSVEMCDWNLKFLLCKYAHDNLICILTGQLPFSFKQLMKRWSDKANLLSRTEYNNVVNSLLSEIYLWLFCLQEPQLISNLSSQNFIFLQGIYIKL